MPWERQPIGGVLLEACVEEIMNFPTKVAGWKVTSFLCEKGHISAALDRDGSLGTGGGSYNWIEPQIVRDDFHPEIITHVAEPPDDV